MAITDYNEKFLSDLFYSRGHFWFYHRNKVIYRAIQKFYQKEEIRILELGAGSGNILSYISSRAHAIDGADIYNESLAYISQFADRTFRYDVRVDPGDAGLIDLNKKYDVVIMGDVIEHLENPALALKNAGYFCKKGGIVIITVPASKGLWSRYDVLSGHKRRYGPDTIREELEAAGLRPVFTKYFFFMAAVILFLRKKAMDRFSGTPKQFIKEKFRINAFFNFLLKLECDIKLPLGEFLNFPFGSSIIAAGRVE